jgi:purine-binding chemotaxis protein CheW
MSLEDAMTVAEMETTNQYLTFNLGDELFGLDISKVREVLDHTKPTKVPRTPDYLRGVINLRGSVVPVIDLRLRFGMAEIATTVNTCIIIGEIAVDGETAVVGSLVDSVQEVLELESEHIEPAPRIGTTLKTEFMKGMGKHDDQFIILLDIDKIVPVNDFKMVKTGQEASRTGGAP